MWLYSQLGLSPNEYSCTAHSHTIKGTTMSTILEQIAALAAQAAQTGINMTEAVKGGGGARTLPTGYAFARLVEYVEYGTQPQTMQGQPKPPSKEFTLGFALTGFAPNPDPTQPALPYANDDGTPYILRTFSIKESANDKAGAYLLFKSMNWKGDKTHFAQLLTDGFLVRIEQYTSKTPGSKPRSIINLKDIRPPVQSNPVTGQTEAYPIAPAREQDLKLFLWDYPTEAAWETFKIDGLNDDGSSKNFIQDKMLGALDFSGSSLEAMLVGSGKPFTRPAPKAVAPAAPQPAAPPAQMPAAVMPAAPTMPTVPAMHVPASPPFPTPHQPVSPATAAVLATPVVTASVPAVPAVTSPSVPVAVSPVAPVVAHAVPAVPAMPSLPAMPAMPMMPA
jgi:hypothetical protein